MHCALTTVCPAPDLILWELWGKTVLPPDLWACKHPIAAYCIDSSINEFWLKDLLRLFDHVFVDQESSVDELRKYGVHAVWLPLCVSESAFRPLSPKGHDISFVGRMSGYRIKRRNLIRHLSAYYAVNLVEGVSSSAMQDIFARSAIVLNENLFNGFTLRVLQGMAAGSLVLTEAGGRGVDAHFTDGAHVRCFTPHSLIGDVEEILRNDRKYAAVALAGQELCRLRHTSRARAEEFLRHVRERSAAHPRLSDEHRKLHEARAGYLLTQRFGGLYGQSIALLNDVLGSGSDAAAGAALTLGDIQARAGRTETALGLYAEAAEGGHSALSGLQAALLLAYNQRMEEGRSLLGEIIAGLPVEHAGLGSRLTRVDDTAGGMAEFLLIRALVYRALGRTFHVGFLKQEQDRFPETALETAFLAWERRPAPEILDCMLECAAEYGIEGEFLPQCLQAIEKGVAEDRQILRAAELAECYYDKDTARAITLSFKKSRRR